ncbi:chromaffin granule amine transporter isoform X1 [Columba livia]|uniref:chromaffin granule amine transporter isoform X1 n=1 Tax=Columba livia TaxID=8932 RepID=UPI0031B9BF7D
MSPGAHGTPWQCLAAGRASRRLVLVVVFVALLLDNMLLTVVVPIVPTFLYTTEYEGANSSVVPAQTELAPPASKFPPFSSVFSYADNTTLSIVGSSSPTELERGTGSAPPRPSGCPEGQEFLANENIRVGLLFASKALVQLVVNPAVGVLTNSVCIRRLLYLAVHRPSPPRHRLLLLIRRRLGHAGQRLHRRPGEGQRHGDRAGRLGLGCADRGSLWERDVRIRGEIISLLGPGVPGSLGWSFAALHSAALQDLPREHQRDIAGHPPARSLHPGGCRSPLLLQHGGGHAGAHLAHLDDANHVLPEVAAWDGIPPGQHILPHRHQPLRASGHQNGPVSGRQRFQVTPALRFPHESHLGLRTATLCYLWAPCRWLCSLIGMGVVGISLLCVPLATNIYGLIIPNAGLGFAIGMVDSSMMPTMGHLVDLRHSSIYGNVYAIADVAFCMGFAIGPSTGGAIVRAVGFPWLMIIIGVINIAYAPLCWYLRNPPAKEEKMAILGQGCPMQTNSYAAQKTLRHFPLTDDSDVEAENVE